MALRPLRLLGIAVAALGVAALAFGLGKTVAPKGPAAVPAGVTSAAGLPVVLEFSSDG